MRFPTLVALLPPLVLCLGPSALGGPDSSGELSRLMNGMARRPGVVARFVETKHLALLEEPIESRGVLYFAPPDRLVREVESPALSRLVIDGDRLAMRDRAGNQDVDLGSNPIAREVVENFVVLFGGDLAALERRYEIGFESAAEGWRLRLVPRAATVRRLIARVEIRGDASGMRELSLFEQDGDRSVTRLLEVDSDHRFTPEELRVLFGDSVP
jgi:hypothetical protein